MTIDEVSITQLNNEDAIAKALELVWSVYLEYEAPDYTQEGIDEFYRSIHDRAYLDMLTMYAAYQKDQMLGIIATRSQGTHVALFFVDGKYHKHGVGRKLFEAALEQNTSGFMTVNSSPYAVPVYHKLGFQDTDGEQTVNGLRFTPIRKVIT